MQTLDKVEPRMMTFDAANNAMSPAISLGDHVTVDLDAAPIVGKQTLFWAGADAAEPRAVLGKLIKISRTRWTVRQFNPARTFSLTRAEFPLACPVRWVMFAD